MSGHAGKTDAACFQLDEEQHVVGSETSPGEYFDGEEVGACQDGHVGGDEIPPRGILAPLGRRRDPVSVQDVPHCLIGDGMAEIAQSADNAVVSPTGVLSGEADDERFHLGRDGGPTWGSAVFGAVELSGNEPPVPGEDGLWFSDAGNLLERSTSEPLADLSESGSLGIGKTHTASKMASQDPIFGDEVLVLEQEFLIDQPGDVRQQPSQFGVWHEEHPS